MFLLLEIGVFDCVFYFFLQGIDTFVTDLNTLHPILTECRVLKSELELALIQFANDVSSEAHVQVTILFKQINLTASIIDFNDLNICI